jgi:hypothetical protein
MILPRDIRQEKITVPRTPMEILLWSK